MLYFIVGKTSTGKDTIAKYMNAEYNLTPVVSYTTRPMRDYETQGKEHIFVSSEEMQKLKQQNLIAYTKNDQTGIEYCATAEALNYQDMTYIINPDGIRWFQENGADLDYRIIALSLDETEQRRRALLRGDKPEVLEQRIQSEREEFDDFLAHPQENHIDLIIDAAQPKALMFLQVSQFLETVKEQEQEKQKEKYIHEREDDDLCQ